MSSQPVVELRFAYGAASAAELQAVIDEVLAEDPVAGLRSGDITVREEGHGVEPITTAIVVGFLLKGGAKVASDVWSDVLWPRLKKRIGTDAVGEQLE
jgi:hypothetical protein